MKNALRYRNLIFMFLAVEWHVWGPTGTPHMPLHLAARTGDCEGIKTLISNRGTNIDIKDDLSGNTPLIMAAAYNQVEAAKILIDSGANVNAANKNRDTPLHIAITQNYCEIVKRLLLDEASILATNHKGETPIDLAKGKPKILNLLLLAAASRGHYDEVQNLLTMGAYVNTRDEYGCTPLYWAAHNNRVEIVKELLKQPNIGLDLPDKSGNTPLIIATEWPYAKIAKMLIDAGANVDSKNSSGQTPLYYAIYHSMKVEHNMPDDRSMNDIVHRLIEANANVNDNNIMNMGNSPLHCAVLSKNLEIVQELIKKNVDLNPRNVVSETPLFLAVSMGCLEIVRVLLKAGADVNIPRNGNYTPLHCIVSQTFGAAQRNKRDSQDDALQDKKNSCDITRILLKAGAKTNLTDRDNKTPLDLATQIKRKDIIALLKTAGAGTGGYKNKPTYFTHAIMRGDVNFVGKAIQDDPECINKPCDYEDYMPLQLANFWEQPEIENMLIQANQVTGINNSKQLCRTSSTNKANTNGWLKLISPQINPKKTSKSWFRKLFKSPKNDDRSDSEYYGVLSK